MTNNIFGLSLFHYAVRNLAHAAHSPCMIAIDLLSFFSACDLDLVSIDDHNSVACIDMGSKVRLMLAAQDLGDLCSKPSQGLSRSIQKKPLAHWLDLFFGKKNGGIV